MKGKWADIPIGSLSCKQTEVPLAGKKLQIGLGSEGKQPHTAWTGWGHRPTPFGSGTALFKIVHFKKRGGMIRGMFKNNRGDKRRWGSVGLSALEQALLGLFSTL